MLGPSLCCLQLMQDADAQYAGMWLCRDVMDSGMARLEEHGMKCQGELPHWSTSSHGATSKINLSPTSSYLQGSSPFVSGGGSSRGAAGRPASKAELKPAAQPCRSDLHERHMEMSQTNLQLQGMGMRQPGKASIPQEISVHFGMHPAGQGCSEGNRSWQWPLALSAPCSAPYLQQE